MEHFVWDESLETGDALVDQQHRDIQQLVVNLATTEDRPDEILGVLDRLMQHVEAHFFTEERLMERAGYAGKQAEHHIAEHRLLTEAARSTVLRYRSGEFTGTGPVVELIREWLAGHVYEHDRLLIAFVRAQNLSAELPEPPLTGDAR